MKQEGIVSINPITGAIKNIYKSSKEFEGLAYDVTGDELYLTSGDNLYILYLHNLDRDPIDYNLPGDTEGLDTTDANTLIGSAEASGGYLVYEYDPVTATVLWQQHVTSIYNDLEAVTWGPWVVPSPPPPPAAPATRGAEPNANSDITVPAVTNSLLPDSGQIIQALSGWLSTPWTFLNAFFGDNAKRSEGRSS